jgi:hypothetical protein
MGALLGCRLSLTLGISHWSINCAATARTGRGADCHRQRENQ